MHMSFYNAGGLKDFLIQGWNANSAGAMVGFCLAVAAVAILLEIMKVERVYLQKKAKQNPLISEQSEEVINERPLVLRPLLIPPSMKAIRRRRICFHLAQSLLHLLQVVIAYLVMLAVMSYNVYIFISVVVGSAIAYFTLATVRDQLMTDTSEISNRENRQSVQDEAEDGEEEEGGGGGVGAVGGRGERPGEETEVKHRLSPEPEPVYS